MTKYDDLLKVFDEEIRSSLDYFEYSHKKIQSLPTDPKKLNEETLNYIR